MIKGNIPRMMERAEEKIHTIFEQTGYPVEAIFEALSNAIIHRDYWDRSREILVSIGNDKVEIINPGSLWTYDRAYKFAKDQNPPRRNPWLYQRLLLIDQKQRFLKYGLGIQRMQRAFPSKKKVKIINISSKNLFKVILPGMEEYTSSNNI